MSSLQCLKRVHLEINHSELVRYSKSTEAAFALGHEVGDIAVQLYGGDEGSYIEYSGGSLSRALAQTGQLMSSMFRTPIFEATLQYEDVLVREDVLLPLEEEEGHSWRLVEVKASTKVKPEHIHDCAVQAWVHLESGYPLSRISLAHIDNQFIYPGDGNYQGLLIEHDLTEQVFELLPSVPIWVEQARTAVAGPMPDTPVGQHCTSPYECPFLNFCWPHDSRYPIMGLGGGRKKLGIWVMDGYRDVRDVPSSEITSETQLRIHRVTSEGIPELLVGARAFEEQLAYPRFYLDFETVGPAIPLRGISESFQRSADARAGRGDDHRPGGGRPCADVHELRARRDPGPGSNVPGPGRRFTGYRQSVGRPSSRHQNQLLPSRYARLLVHQGRVADHRARHGLRLTRGYPGRHPGLSSLPGGDQPGDTRRQDRGNSQGPAEVLQT